MSDGPLLTIAIPTWNRAEFLRLTLREIQAQRRSLPADAIELLICDNGSTDSTREVIENAGTPAIRVVRHAENIGSDRNIAACFNLAKGQYVWILGDDDVPVEGVLAWLCRILPGSGLGLVYLRPYGYEQDFNREFPGKRGKRIGVDATEYHAAAQFLARVGAHLTFISSIVVCKTCIADIDADRFVGTNLVQVEIYLSAVVQSRRFLYSNSYCVACKRNNSGGYDFAEVFVERLGRILDRYRSLLPVGGLNGLERAMLVRYFPQYVWKLKRSQVGIAEARRRFRTRYSSFPAYWVLIEPIFSLPRPLSNAWGALVVVLGRTAGGDFKRGVKFAFSRVTSTRLLPAKSDSNPDL